MKTMAAGSGENPSESHKGNLSPHFVLSSRSRPSAKEETMKEFHCGSLVPGCDWHTRHEDEAEVMRRAVEHMRETHGETIIRESMIDAIRSRIEKVRDAA
jgi:predicted small metal-binding protein